MDDHNISHSPCGEWWFSVGLDMYVPLTVLKVFSVAAGQRSEVMCIYIYMRIFQFKKKDGIIYTKRKKVKDRNKKCYPQKMMSNVQNWWQRHKSWQQRHKNWWQTPKYMAKNDREMMTNASDLAKNVGLLTAGPKILTQHRATLTRYSSRKDSISQNNSQFVWLWG